MARRSQGLYVLVGFASLASLAACTSVLGISDGEAGTGDAGDQSFPPAEAGPQSESDADPSPDADAPPKENFREFTTKANWETHSLGGAELSGVVAVGNYVYFAASSRTVGAGKFWRYDRTKPFDSNDAWASFMPTALKDILFTSLTYDGQRYIYSAPYAKVTSGGNVSTAIIMRLDTTQTFTEESAWEYIDQKGPSGTAEGGWGGPTFDGTFMYFTPYFAGERLLRVRASLTKAEFTDVKKWEEELLSSHGHTGNYKFNGAVNGNGKLYFFPVTVAPGTSSADALVYTPGGSLSDSQSWSKLTIGSAANPIAGFQSAVYDGNALYLAPYAGTPNGTIPRISLADGVAPSYYVSTSAKNFSSMSFDTRHVYLFPTGAAFAPIATRFDTRAPFGEASSWTNLDLRTLDANLKGCAGSAFDGTYVYVSCSPILRFRAVDDAVTVPFPQGSIF
jgi:hypothetical protein